MAIALIVLCSGCMSKHIHQQFYDGPARGPEEIALIKVMTGTLASIDGIALAAKREHGGAGVFGTKTVTGSGNSEVYVSASPGTHTIVLHAPQGEAQTEFQLDLEANHEYTIVARNGEKAKMKPPDGTEVVRGTAADWFSVDRVYYQNWIVEVIDRTTGKYAYQADVRYL